MIYLREHLDNMPSFTERRFKTLQLYFNEIFKDLGKRIGEQKIPLSSLHEFLGLPMIVTEKLFHTFSISKKGLTRDHFINNFTVLYAGELGSRVKLLFQIFDFDYDNIISLEDIQLLFLHLGMIQHCSNEVNEIKEIVAADFPKGGFIDYTGFIDFITTKNSDIVTLFFFFLTKFSPFSDRQIQYYQGQAKQNNEERKETPNIKIRLVEPSMKLLNYCHRFGVDQKRTFSSISITKETIDEELNELCLFEKDIHQAIESASKETLAVHFKTSEFENPKVLASNISRDKLSNFFKSRSTRTRVQSYIDPKMINNVVTHQVCESDKISKSTKNLPNIRNDSDRKEELLNFSDYSSCENIQNEKYHSIILYSLKSGKMKKCKLVLVDDSLFYYKFNCKTGLCTFKKLISLKATFINSCLPAKFNGQTFFPIQFKSYYNSKNYTLIFLSANEKEINSFEEEIRLVTHTRNIEDHFAIGEEIGQGKFGNVRIGENKLSGEKVAIKIIGKANLGKTEEERLLLRREVDIFQFLKNATHPGIVKPLDLFETENYVCFVYEYLSGGDFKSYITTKKSELTPNAMKKFTTQLINAVGFLHQCGIMHRDLKPTNILISESQSEVCLKIIDFGFSKVMGQSETTTESYGSLLYTAPEILLDIPYNHQVDVWSLGVIIYYMSRGYYPFSDIAGDHEKIKEAIAYKSYEMITYNSVDNESTSENFIPSVIQGCLDKSYLSRAVINELKNIMHL